MIKFKIMCQRIFVLTVFFLLIFQTSFAQEVTIPFRDGNKWGFCDVDGKITVSPQFDGFRFGNFGDYHDFIYTKKDNLEGVFFNGKEILKPIYYEIFQQQDRFIAKSNQKKQLTQIFTIKGEPIFDKEVALVLDYGFLRNDAYVYHVLHPNNLESVYVFDIIQQKITQILYTNMFSISRIKKQFDVNQFVFLVQKNKNSDLVEETWDITKLPLVKNNLGFRYMKEDEYLSFFADKYPKNEYSTSKYSTNGYEMSSGDLDYLDYVVAAPPVASERNDDYVKGKTKEPVIKNHFNYQFKKQNSSYVLEKRNYKTYSEKEEITVNIPENASNIEIKYDSFNTINDTNDEISHTSFIKYQLNNKITLLFSNDIENPISFDFVDETYSRLKHNNYKTNGFVFLVGNLDEKNQLKYGLFSNVKKQIVPCKYDAYQFIQLVNTTGENMYVFTENTKKGIIYSDGTTMLNVTYDVIDLIKSNSGANPLVSIAKDNKFGLVYNYNNNIEVVEPVFDYPIKDIIKSYPNINNRQLFDTKISAKKIVLIELQDKNGIFKGFANTNGTLYFKN